MKKIFETNPMLIFQIPLALFLVFGLVGLYFMVTAKNSVPVAAWLIVVFGFVFLPGYLLVHMMTGFSPSEKAVQAAEEQREILLFDEKGLTQIMPLMDATCFIAWDSINTIVYTDYDTDDYTSFTFYLSSLPDCKQHENPWWLNRLFPFKVKRNKVLIKDDANNFYELPEAVKKYLNVDTGFSFKDQRKGELLSSTTKQSANGVVRTEHWRPEKNREACQLLYDKAGRDLKTILQMDQ